MPGARLVSLAGYHTVAEATLTPCGATPLSPAIGVEGVWLLILRVAPRLNSRAEPEHYIQALAPAEARKNEGVGASPPRCDNNAYAVLRERQDHCTQRPDPPVPTSPRPSRNAPTPVGKPG